jgi:prolyl-tRNA synthetase
MFADWELVGVPHRVVLSDRGLKEGKAEYQGRRDAQSTQVQVTDMLEFLKDKLSR